MLDADQLHILQHSLGVDQYGRGAQYRNHFVTEPGTTDYPHCTALVEAGLMTRRAGNALSGGADIFIVTPAGVRAVAEHSPAPPKLTRSQQRYEDFLSEDSGLSFGSWLRAGGGRARA